jgi:hypothetical protein
LKVTVATHHLDVEVVDEHGDAPSGEGVSDADVVEAKEGEGLAFSRTPGRPSRIVAGAIRYPRPNHDPSKRWRVAMSTDVISFSSIQELADAMQRAEAAHGEHEKRIGKADPAWPAKYMVAEKAGEELPL